MTIFRCPGSSMPKACATSTRRSQWSLSSLINRKRLFATSSIAPKVINVDTQSEDYQFLPRSSLPSYYFQKSLPRLPIPKLELTCQRYLEALTPILPKEKLEKTTQIVKEFEADLGQKLHNELLQMDKALKHTSYICEPWFEMYLRDRQPLPININPALVFVEDDCIDKLPKQQRQLIRATNLIVSSLRFMKTLDKEILGPEVYHLNPKKSDTPLYRRVMQLLPTSYATYGSYLFKAFPLDMSQYPSLFRSTRIPEKDIDRLQKSDKDTKHIVVMRRGHFYSCPVLDANGNILPVNELLGSLESIINDDRAEESHPLGVMTSQNRDKWAEIRKHMINLSSKNRSSLNEIDSALYVMCLDDEELGTDPVTVTKQYLHSDGCNRWFDKSFTIILSKDGWAGVNFEHAWGDGVAVMRFFNDIHRDASAHQWSNDIKAKRPFIPPVKLTFDLDGKAKEGIEDAKIRLRNQSESLELRPFILELFGKKACKKWSISPDSVMQLGFQIAYYKMFNHCPATYESCSTSAFKHGRTETIRPATMFTKEVCELLSKNDWSENKDKLKELIRKCSEKHGVLTKDAAMGQGFDRHLFALRTIAKSKGLDIPKVFQDEAYSHINHNILSTSTLSSPAVRVGAFGPVVTDGFGIAYQIWDTGLGCVAATYKGQKDGQAFVEECQNVFSDIHTTMNS